MILFWTVAKIMLQLPNVIVFKIFHIFIAIDATMYIMNQFSTKPLLVKTGDDLAAEFCKRVNQELVGAETVLTGFESYSKDSLTSKAC